VLPERGREIERSVQREKGVFYLTTLLIGETGLYKKRNLKQTFKPIFGLRVMMMCIGCGPYLVAGFDTSSVGL
jgi:hypothetical protein